MKKLKTLLPLLLAFATAAIACAQTSTPPYNPYTQTPPGSPPTQPGNTAAG